MKPTKVGQSLFANILMTRIERLEEILERAELVLRENGRGEFAEEIDCVLNETIDFNE